VSFTQFFSWLPQDPLQVKSPVPGSGESERSKTSSLHWKWPDNIYFEISQKREKILFLFAVK